jgi:hypothetical protein
MLPILINRYLDLLDIINSVESPPQLSTPDVIPPAEAEPALPPSTLLVTASPEYDGPDIAPLAQALVDQLLQHHGCCHNEQSLEATRPSSAVTVAELIEQDCPDVLGKSTIAQHPTPWDELCPPAQRRLLYTGLNREPSLSAPVHPPVVDVEQDTVPPGDSLQVRMDIDSAGGIASSLAVAREGLQWRAGRPAKSNLQSSLHLEPLAVQWTDYSTGRLRHARQPIHRIPHLPIGRFGEFPLEMYVIFPRLYEPTRQHWVITQEEYALWTDHIFLPALRQSYPSSIIQHLPSSAAQIQFNATAVRQEGLAKTSVEAPRTQDFHFMLQPEALNALWERIQRHTEQAGLSQFQQCRILVTTKNLKLTTQRPTWAQARDVFFRRWNRAVDMTYIEQDFYDVAKEVVPCLENSGSPALMLSWRECCLHGFCDWLGQHEAEHEAVSTSSPEPEPVRRRRRVGLASTDVIANTDDSSGPVSEYSPSSDSETDDAIEDETEVEEKEREERYGLESLLSSDSTTSSVQKPAPPWRQVYYPQSFLRAQGSLTLAPSPQRSLWKRGLLYCQFYNTSKEILAAGNHYPFQNKRLDTLALDPGMARTWQHVGGAVSHSPLALLRAYNHIKGRCHAALLSCRDDSYGTREEYRITGALLHQLDRLLEQRGLAQSPLTVSAGHTPFFVHTTPLMLDWWRWNLNKLCLGFEMTYSLQPRTVVHWEHTRVMMMFLQCLMYAYGGQGRHLRHKVGLWIDRRVRQPCDGSDQDQVQEGMAIGPHLEQYGYAWMADKLDWAAMTFRSPYRAYILFNTPSLQSVYHERYWQVVETKEDFLLFHDAFHQLQILRHDTRRSALLLRLLVDLCLRMFRKDVFRALEDRHTRQPLHQSHLHEACAGRVPLTGDGMRHVFEHRILNDDFHFVTGSNMRVSHVENLFAWLWGWDGDGSQGDWPRLHWEFKPYRMLYRQCFGMIAQVHGIRQAREWRLRLKQTWIRTHWILPYPSAHSFWSRGPHRRLQTWASVHRRLVQYYQCRVPTHSGVIPTYEVDDLPVSGWERGSAPSSLDVELPLVPTDLNEWLAAIEDSPPDSVRDIPLPAPGVRPTDLSRSLQKLGPSQRVLRSFIRDREISENQLHDNEEWLSQHLVDHLRVVIAAHQQEIRGLQQPTAIRRWQARSRPTLTQGLSQVNLSIAQIEHEDSDPENSRNVRNRLTRRLGRMQKRLQLAEEELQELNQCNRRMDHTYQMAHRPSRSLTKKQWDDELQIFRDVRNQHRQSRLRLSRLSRESTRL